MTDNWFVPSDTLEQAWAKYRRAHPEVLACYRQQTGRWPMGHPNDPAVCNCRRDDNTNCPHCGRPDGLVPGELISTNSHVDRCHRASVGS